MAAIYYAKKTPGLEEQICEFWEGLDIIEYAKLNEVLHSVEGHWGEF
jgi:hypothetical protein